MPHIPLNLNPHTDLELFGMFQLDNGNGDDLWYFTPKQRGGVTNDFDADKVHHDRTDDEQKSAVSDLATYYHGQMAKYDGDKFALLPCGVEESYFGPEHQEVPE